MSRRKSLLTYVCVLLFSNVLISNQAIASALSSSAAWVDPGSYHGCTVTNVSSKDVKNVTIEILNDGGVSKTKVVDVLSANNTVELVDNDVPPFGGFKFCKVKAPKASVRATLNVYRNIGGTYYLVLGSYPLQ